MKQTRTQERNRDFMAACRRKKSEIMARDGHLDVDTIVEEVLNESAPSYYISYARALRNVRPLMRDNIIPTRRRRTDRMALELAGKCRRIIEERNGKLTLGEALARVLTGERASGYFISSTYARRLYFRVFSERCRSRRRSRRLL